MKCVWCRETIEETMPFSFFLFPITCPVCPNCKKLLGKLEGQSICEGCGRPSKENFCYDCVRWKEQLQEKFVSNHSLYCYDVMGKEWMERYKFVGDCQVVSMIVEDVKTFLHPLVKQGYCLCPLPSSKNSLIKREFETIEYILEKTKLPNQQLLVHIGTGKKQSEKTRKERMHLEQPFRIKEGIYLPKKVVLVDDVYTTGTTIRLAAQCLQEAGVNNILLRTIFR